MQTILIEKLRSFLVENAPEKLIALQQDFSVTRYLEDKVYTIMPLAERLAGEGKPPYIIEELCLAELTRDLLPSKFLFIRNILENEFPETYERFREIGVLAYETINLIEACKPVFEKYGFTEENEDDRMLRYTIIGTISEYLEQK